MNLMNLMNFQLELTTQDPTDVNYLSSGYISIIGQDTTISNKGLMPNQACTLFPSIALLMDQLVELEMHDQQQRLFCALGSNFRFKMELIGEELKLTSDIGEIQCTIDSFAKKLWCSFQELIKIYTIEIEDLGAMSEDLFMSQLNFKVTFAFVLNS